VSKKIKAWLRKNENLEHWHISEDRYAHDVFYNIKEHIKSEETQFLKHLLKYSTSSKNFQRIWLDAAHKTNQLQKEFLKQIPYSDLMVFREMHKAFKGRLQLHFANSTPVRYSQFFNFDKQSIIDSNRGVSGIDGSVSTALGQSLCFNGQTILISGDLSFFYDNNALWNKYIHQNFKIILINNSGGGIFRFIDGPLNSGKIDLFETPHKRNARNLSQDAGMEYLVCEKQEDLRTKINALIKSLNSCILEVFTPREINDQVLKDYFKFLRNG
jgi:2-succinyl-5-enolpyruvyl-6-hydroxy-3-cyclohexene-1-carboxylate synthase